GAATVRSGSRRDRNIGGVRIGGNRLSPPRTTHRGLRMSPEVLLRAANLGKEYPLRSDARSRATALFSLIRGVTPPRTCVLAGVNLHVERGQSLGIIGENGSGKSTLLKMISGVLTPTHGHVATNGSVGALLELGAGFDLDRTGLDNIWMSAGLMGWSNSRIGEELDKIIAFADIGRYINEPVKHYSSGMVVRLGFAVIAAVRPDLLITDEVLAVGDESFQRKCIAWMESYLEAGGTLLLVSHSMYHIQKLCRQALWLKDGSVEAYGDVFDVTQAYLAYHERKSGRQAQPGADRAY